MNCKERVVLWIVEGLSNIKGDKRSAIMGVSFAGRRPIAVMVPKFVDVDSEIFEL
jgi:hypothetical protein